MKFVAFLFIIGMLFSNSAQYYLWMAGNDPIAFELNDPLDGESEKDSRLGEDADDKKVQVDYDALKSLLSADLSKYFHYFNLNSNHELEIPTPPPESFSFIS